MSVRITGNAAGRKQANFLIAIENRAQLDKRMKVSETRPRLRIVCASVREKFIMCNFFHFLLLLSDQGRI